MVQLEYKVGPLKVNLRVLLEPKGFLRIIILFIAILAFSTTAGFNSGSSSNSIQCLGSNNISYSAVLTFNYPYSSGSFEITPDPRNGINTTIGFKTLAHSSSAEFFVAMGVMTMLYVIGALVLYILFITPELFLAKWLVIADFIITILFGVLYLIACIAWSAGAAQLRSYVGDKLEEYGTDVLGCTSNDVSSNLKRQTLGLPAVSLILGYLVSFIWLATTWFVYKDTVWHKDRTGPLSSIYNITNSKSESESKSTGGGNE